MLSSVLSRGSLVLLLVGAIACSSGEQPLMPQEPEDSGSQQDAGHPPDAGDPTDGGQDAGPPPDAGACADDDPCTAEFINEQGECMRPPAPDGTVCDDGRACTTRDQCLAGSCRGESTSSLPPAIQSTLWSFGADPIEGGKPPLEGLAEFLSEDRLLFGESLGAAGLSVSLVRAGPDGLQTLDQASLNLRVEHFFGGRNWSDRLLTFFVPLGPNRVVAVGTRQYLELLDTDRDRLTSLSKYTLPFADDIVAGVGRESRFWVCSGYWIVGYTVSSTNTIAPDPLHQIPLSAPCHSLSLSENGSLLWVATSKGLVAIDLTPSSGPVARAAILQQQGFFHLQVNNTYGVAQELLNDGELGKVFVYRTQDLETSKAPTPVFTLSPSEGPTVWERPVGTVLYEHGLLVEWFRVSGETRAYQLEYHPMTPSGPGAAVHQRVLREGNEVGLHLSPLILAGRGRRAITQPWRRLVEIGASGELSFSTGTRHGSLERVWKAEDGSFRAAGPFGIHQLTVADPLAPVLTGAGLHLPATTNRLRLAPMRSENSLLELVTLPMGTTPHVHQEAGTAIFSCLRPGPQGFSEQGTLRVEGGPAALASAPGKLFQAVSQGAGKYGLKTFSLPDECSGVALPASTARSVQVGPERVEPRAEWTFAVNAEGTEALMSSVRDEGTSQKMALAWLGGPGMNTVARGELPQTTGHFLALAGQRALVVENRTKVYVLRRDGTRIITDAQVDLSQRTSPVQVSHNLHFDGKMIYLGISSPSTGVLVLRASDLSEHARYESPGPVRSVALAGAQLVLGMNNALSVGTSICIE